MTAKKHLHELTLLRGMAILGVLAIHVQFNSLIIHLGSAEKHISPVDLSKYSVPLFIFISGLVLTYKYYDNPPNYPEFIGKRLRRVLIPYIVWSLIYILYRNIIKDEAITATTALKKIVIGSAYFHLYYLVLIIQFYIFYPTYLKLLKKLKEYPNAILIAAFTLNLLFNHLYETHPIIQGRLARRIFIFWIFYFTMGTFTGIKLSKKPDRDPLTRLSTKLLALLLLLTIPPLIQASNIDGTMLSKLDIFWARKTTLLYASASILLLTKLAFNNLTPLFHRNRPLSKALETIGRYSFGIYLIHLIILEILKARLNAIGITGISGKITLFILTLTFSLYLVKIINKLPYGHLIAGAEKQQSKDRRGYKTKV